MTNNFVPEYIPDIEKFDDFYRALIEETENVNTLRDRTKNQRLKDFLFLCEWLMKEHEDDPIEYFFGK